jgi:hypothetical protein
VKALQPPEAAGHEQDERSEVLRVRKFVSWGSGLGFGVLGFGAWSAARFRICEINDG